MICEIGKNYSTKNIEESNKEKNAVSLDFSLNSSASFLHVLFSCSYEYIFRVYFREN